MSENHHQGEDVPRIREMIIDDLSEVFHIGEDLFTAEYSQSLYRTWDEYEITTLFNSDNELVYRGAPDWGKDGIVFVETDAAAGESRLVVVQPDGSGRKVVRTEASGFRMGAPRWIPAAN